jgi:class 3 adenylate cyclase/predicted ATPase
MILPTGWSYGAVMDIGVWLRSLGLSQYEAIFRENAIDADVLTDLTEDHLREIGLPLGARLKILKAISALALRPESIEPTPAVVPASQAADIAERRQVTVMFSDLVGSTVLSARMDPEDLREVIAAYHKCVADIVRRFDGFVAQYLGDGVLVYFGYPQAHEDDAERAVQASLELIAAVTVLKTRSTLQTRVAIATGLVVVGDILDAGGSQERGIIGETPNLAARLQGIAQPNTVVVSESTRRLLGDLFELQDLGAKALKGVAGPVRAWAALRARSVESRFEALHTSGLTALVGRDEETEILSRRWSRAKSNEGQVLLLSGEAGIGKSRLTAALLERVASEPHTRLRYFCSPQHTDSALYPIIGQMERAAGLSYDDKSQTRLDKLDATLAQTSTSIQDAALFAEMLSLPNDGRYPLLDLRPEQRRQRTLDALMGQLETLARQNPVLMIFEDAHWADPTSLEVFGRTVERIRLLRVLLVVTFRPEFEPPWIGQPHVTALTINRLAEREIGALIDCVVGNKMIGTSIRQDIIERTDGIPLFVEEMTKAVLETESDNEARQTVAAVPSSARAVPASLHASLMARLDRLGPAKEVAQVGAAIGREFSHSLLAAVMNKPAADLGSVLNRLIGAGLLFCQGLPPHANYLFKHALVQDTAYGTLLRDARRSLHARIAASLERHFVDIVETQPELLARHCTEAMLIEKSVELWRKAGQRSLARSALVEAAEHITHALDQIATLPPTAARRREQIELQVALLNPLMHTEGYAAPKTKEAVERARELIEQSEALGEHPEDPLLLFSVLYGLWVANFLAFNGDALREVATQFLALADKRRGTVPLMIGHELMGTSSLFTGDVEKGRLHLDQALALYDPAEHRRLATRFGHDVGMIMLCRRAQALWLLGHLEASATDTYHALESAREIGLASSLMCALSITSHTHLLSGNYAVSKAQDDELVSLAEEKGSPFWMALGRMHQGWLFALTGKPTDAVQMISSAIHAYRSTGATLYMPSYLSVLATAYAELGKFDDAWRCSNDAMTAMEATNERWLEAEVHRMAGEVARRSPQPYTAKAEAYFERALTIARTQTAKSWELRAAMSLARLWRNEGDSQRAFDLLRPVYRWFTEGLDTLDLKQAKALLDELASDLSRP